MQGLSFGFTTNATRAEVAALEELDIDSLWSGGHIAAPNGSPEAMQQLARIAALAERVRVGTSILLLPLYPPAIVAKQIANLDQATNGRVDLGIGVGGEYPAEFSACQIPVAERGKRTDESIPLIRRLWTAEEISHPGPFYPMEGVRMFPPPVQPGGPPIIVSGRKPPAMRRAAALGDGWMPYLYSPRAYAESVQQITALAAERNRSLERFQWTLYLFINVSDDPDRSREELAGFLGGTYSQDFNAFVDRVAAAGTPDKVAARVQEYVNAGARRIIFSIATRGDRLAMMRRVMSEVAPRLSVPA
jgi:probable F420-dependent oxidoreductase